MLVWPLLLWLQPAPPGVELIADPTFQRGFRVLDPAPGKKIERGRLPGPVEGEPVWQLAQWSSRHCLAGAVGERLAGALIYRNAGKLVALAPPGTEAADLRLGVTASAEYDRARRAGEPWVHLLAEQRLDGPPLTELTALPFQAEIRLNRSVLRRTDDYTPRLHAAQYQVFLTVQNLNRQSAGYGDFYWFGIQLYDDRQARPRGYVNGDQGTGKLIYSPAECVPRTSAHDGEWVRAEIDLLPLVKAGLTEAWRRGYLPDSRELADYRLGGLNLGWEVPGLFDVEIQLRGLSLRAVGRPGP